MIVPDNKTCIIHGPGTGSVAGNGVVTITGNLTVGKNSSLIIGGITHVLGNLQASKCNSVSINPSSLWSATVSGSVQIKNCVGSTAVVLGVPANTAFYNGGPANNFGDFQCSYNSGACILQDAVVDGNVQVENNTGSQSTISGNFIAKDLACDDNSPAPTDASVANTVGAGHQKSGQCAAF